MVLELVADNAVAHVACHSVAGIGTRWWCAAVHGGIFRVPVRSPSEE